MALINNGFWSGRPVFVTGHTGFKGSWLSLWLHRMGAVVSGYALDPPTSPSLYELARISELLDSRIADIRDLQALTRTMDAAAPEVVFHLAAQSLVRDSYTLPVETYATNVMGTVHLLEAVRRCPSVRAVVIVTTDKVYDNREWGWGYRENEPLGGHDPYSSSKACSELVVAAYRSSFFKQRDQRQYCAGLATARAGNVIGGGDWASDRLVPDIIRALSADETVRIRNPRAIRPWQHVLEPLSGYLKLAEKLYEENERYAAAWNFGPSDEDARPVEWIVRRMCELWDGGLRYELDRGDHPHEAHYLKLDCSRARMELDWFPRWGLDKALASIVEWSQSYRSGADMRQVCLQQIEEYGAFHG